MLTPNRSLLGAALALLVTISLFVPLATYARTCDYNYRDERDYVIAALIIPLSISFLWLLYSAAIGLTIVVEGDRSWLTRAGRYLPVIVALTLMGCALFGLAILSRFERSARRA